MVRSLFIVGLVQFALLAEIGKTQTWRVCLEDQANLSAPAMGAFQREFLTLVGAHGVELVDSACPSGAILLSLQRRGANHDPDVLGAAHRRDATIEPRLEVYIEPVRELIPEVRCWTTIGRALARVAAHEVAHYVDQSVEHSERGLLNAGFSGTQLAGGDSHPFRWIRSER